MSDKQDKDGLMQTHELENFIDSTLRQAAKDMGLDTTNYKEVCASKYEKKRDYLDPEEHRMSIYKTFLSEYNLVPEPTPV